MACDNALRFVSSSRLMDRISTPSSKSLTAGHPAEAGRVPALAAAAAWCNRDDLRRTRAGDANSLPGEV
jgi:hypothetical protein